MAVILPNAELAVAKKEHRYERSPHGKPVARAVELPLTEHLPGAILERADSGTEQGIEWALRLDPTLWPVGEGDHVHERAGDRVWVVTASSLKQVVGYDAVDYVAVTAVLERPDVP